MDGSNSPLLVRALADMANWMINQSGDIEVVGEAFAKMREILISSGVGGHQDPYPSRHWLADNAVPYEGAKQSAWGSRGGAPLRGGGFVGEGRAGHFGLSGEGPEGSSESGTGPG